MKAYILPFLLLLIGLGILAACRPGKLSPKAYVQWVENPENGLEVVREMGAYRLTARLMPSTYWMLTQSETSEYSQEDAESNIWYVQLRVESKNPQEPVMKQGIVDEQAYQERLQYFKYGMQNDLYFVQAQDSLEAVLYHHEQSFGLTPFTTSLIAFEDKSAQMGARTLVLDDQNLGIGPVKFLFSQATIARIPQLNL